MLVSIDQINRLAAFKPTKTIVMAAAEDDQALAALSKACQMGMAHGVVVGDQQQIRTIAETHEIDLQHLVIIHQNTPEEAAIEAVSLIKLGDADILMKGRIKTATLLKEVLKKEAGLRTGNLISHVVLMELENYHKLLALTDAAMNIAPSTHHKIEIIKNGVLLLNRLGIRQPKVALLAAVEEVNPAMPVTVEANEIVQKLTTNPDFTGLLQGPLAFDIATRPQSAKIKGVNGPVAGDADLLLAPNIEVGNVLYKSLAFFANAKCAGIVTGTRSPIILNSRSDSEATKLSSIALAVALSE